MHRTFPSFGTENAFRESRLLHQQGVEQPQQQPPPVEMTPLPRTTQELNKAVISRERTFADRTGKGAGAAMSRLRFPERSRGAQPAPQRTPEELKQLRDADRKRIDAENKTIRDTPEFQEAQKNFEDAITAHTGDSDRADRLVKSVRGLGLGANFEKIAYNVIPFLVDMGLIDLTRPPRNAARPAEGPNKQRLEELETAKATREKSVKAAQGSVSRGMWGIQFANHSLIETADKHIDAELKLLNDTQNLPPELQARIPELKKVKEELQKIRKASVNLSPAEKKKKEEEEAAKKGGS